MTLLNVNIDFADQLQWKSTIATLPVSTKRASHNESNVAVIGGDSLDINHLKAQDFSHSATILLDNPGYLSAPTRGALNELFPSKNVFVCGPTTSNPTFSAFINKTAIQNETFGLHIDICGKSSTNSLVLDAMLLARAIGQTVPSVLTKTKLENLVQLTSHPSELDFTISAVENSLTNDLRAFAIGENQSVRISSNDYLNSSTFVVESFDADSSSTHAPVLMSYHRQALLFISQGQPERLASLEEYMNFCDLIDSY